MRDQFKIEGQDLIPIANTPADISPHSTKLQVFRELETGLLEWVGLRSVTRQSFDLMGTKWGWTNVSGNQVKTRGCGVNYLGRLMDIAVIPYKSLEFVSLFPLATYEDAKALQDMGLTGAAHAKAWARKMGWKGEGSAKAGEQIKRAWIKVLARLPRPACPLVTFPGDVPPVVAAPDWRDEMEARMQAMEARLTALEFTP